MPFEDYRRFSAPFDRRIPAAIPDGRLNILHLHVEESFLDAFRGFPAPIVNCPRAVSGIPIETLRNRFPQVIADGLDELHFRDLGPSELQEQWNSARSAAGPKFILTPGCSVPNDSRPEELSRLPQLHGPKNAASNRSPGSGAGKVYTIRGERASDLQI